MKKRKLKNSVLYGITIGVFALLLGLVYYVNYANANLKNKEDDDYQYVSRLFGEDVEPVVNTTETILRPYTDSNVKVVQDFYDYKADEKKQENSIINYDQTYIQNNGVAYGGLDSSFDVISSLPGTVTSVKEDKLLGTIVEIKNTDKITTIYQTLTDVKVKENDKINQGDVIGKSSESNINKDLKIHFVFELKINDTFVNPEDYYEKNINEI